MAEITKNALLLSLEVLMNYDETKANEVIKIEGIVDKYEDVLGSYLVKVSGKNISHKDGQSLSIILHSISDFERISDHALCVVNSAKEIHDKGLAFSDNAKDEINILCNAVGEIMELTTKSFCNEDTKEAIHVEPLEEVIDTLSKTVKEHHIERLRLGKCTIEMGFILSDITTNYERVSDHCSNIALSLLQLNEENFDTHEYQETISSKDNVAFTSEVEHLKERYQLP